MDNETYILKNTDKKKKEEILLEILNKLDKIEKTVSKNEE